MNKKNEVATKSENAVGAANPFARKSTSQSTIDRKDILIPKLLLMQGLSELVADEKASMGDLVNSVTGKVLSKGGKPLNIIPLTHFKTWVIYEIIDKKAEYKEIVPYTPANADWEWTATEGGVELRRDQCLNFYVMVEDEMKDPRAFPYLLTFRRTSYRSGRKLVNHFTEAEMADLEPYAGIVALSAYKDKNDDGVFYVFDIAPVKDTPPEYAEKLVKWVETLSQNQHKVDNSDLEEKAAADVPKPSRAEKDATKSAEY